MNKNFDQKIVKLKSTNLIDLYVGNKEIQMLWRHRG
jgi:hypothetical protein